MPPRARDAQPRMFRCTESFAFFRDGRPHVFAGGQEVLEGDPVLSTHGAFFEAAEDAVSRRASKRTAEAASAAPGELRTVAPSAVVADGPSD